MGCTGSGVERVRTAVVPNGRCIGGCDPRRRLLITAEEVSALARPCYADVALVERCIDEAQDFDIRPVIGDELYEELMASTQYDTLMNGGWWIDGCGRKRFFKGLKTALAYYAYARTVRIGSSVQTRFGLVDKSEEYSYHSSTKDRMAQYDEAFSIGYKHLLDVLEYVKNNLDALPACCAALRGRVRPETTKFYTIGE